MTLRLTYITPQAVRHDLLVKGTEKVVRRQVKLWQKRVGPRRATYRQILTLE